MTNEYIYETYLAHHGVKGMKWGVRRYQDYGEGGYNPKDGKGHKAGSSSNNRSESQPSKKYEYKENSYEENSEDYDYKSKESEYTHKGSGSGEDTDSKMGAEEYTGKKGHKYIEGDYDGFGDEIDSVAHEAANIYSKKGREAATEYLIKSLGQHSFKAMMSEEMETYREDGEDLVYKYHTVSLDIIGKKYSYHTSGDGSGYSDDQYFSKNK